MANLEASHFEDNSLGLLYKANQELFCMITNSSLSAFPPYNGSLSRF